MVVNREAPKVGVESEVEQHKKENLTTRINKEDVTSNMQQKTENLVGSLSSKLSGKCQKWDVDSVSSGSDDSDCIILITPKEDPEARQTEEQRCEKGEQTNEPDSKLHTCPQASISVAQNQNDSLDSIELIIDDRDGATNFISKSSRGVTASEHALRVPLASVAQEVLAGPKSRGQPSLVSELMQEPDASQIHKRDAQDMIDKVMGRDMSILDQYVLNQSEPAPDAQVKQSPYSRPVRHPVLSSRSMCIRSGMAQQIIQNLEDISLKNRRVSNIVQVKHGLRLGVMNRTHVSTLQQPMQDQFSISKPQPLLSCQNVQQKHSRTELAKIGVGEECFSISAEKARENKPKPLPKQSRAAMDEESRSVDSEDSISIEADDQEAGTGELMIVSHLKNPVFSSSLPNLRLLENFNRLPKEKRAEKEPHGSINIP